MPKWMTTAEAARYLGVSPNTIRLWRKDGKISSKQIGRQWMVDVESIQDIETVKHFHGDLQSVCNKVRGLVHHPALLGNEQAQEFIKAMARLLYSGTTYLIDFPLTPTATQETVLKEVEEVRRWLG